MDVYMHYKHVKCLVIFSHLSIGKKGIELTFKKTDTICE